MQTYSMDLRERVVEAVKAGMPVSVASRTFSVSRATVDRWVHRERVGTLEPRPHPGRTRTIGREQEAALRAQLAATPDATLAEHVETWHAEQGVRVSVATMGRAIARLGWTRKKRHSRRASAIR